MNNEELMDMINVLMKKSIYFYFCDEIEDYKSNIVLSRMYFNSSFIYTNFKIKIIIEHACSTWIEIINTNNNYFSSYESVINETLYGMNIDEIKRYINEDIINHIVREFYFVFKNNDFIWSTPDSTYNYYIYKENKFICNDFHEYFEKKRKLKIEIQNKVKDGLEKCS